MEKFRSGRLVFSILRTAGSQASAHAILELRMRSLSFFGLKSVQN